MKSNLPSVLVLSASELELHLKRPLFKDMIHIKGSKEVYVAMKAFIDPERICHKEFFWIMLLTSANRVVGIAEVASGGTNGVHINLKEIFQFILLTNASGFIAVHNHPSGNLNPSVSDRNITKKLQKLARLIDSNLVDHLIVSQEGYYSFSDDHSL
jgi:DNA repair protein RadC